MPCLCEARAHAIARAIRAPGHRRCEAPARWRVTLSPTRHAPNRLTKNGPNAPVARCSARAFTTFWAEKTVTVEPRLGLWSLSAFAFRDLRGARDQADRLHRFPRPRPRCALRER